ncbi:MAG: hypothetical protein ACOYNB_12015 [Aquabacterium sp.]|uniref:hypothetical protein n=1 Tax=Aquabacterium sp. TaxID=1872578 RepID=UPI003BC1C1AB
MAADTHAPAKRLILALINPAKGEDMTPYILPRTTRSFTRTLHYDGQKYDLTAWERPFADWYDGAK